MEYSDLQTRKALSEGFPPGVAAKFKADRNAREKVKTDNPALFRAVSEALFRNDPMGIAFGTNADEYDPETGTIIPRLSGCCSGEDVHVVVYEEFCTWFGVETAGPKHRYKKGAEDIWQVYNKMEK